MDLADYLHSDTSSLIGRGDFLKLFHDTSTLELSQRFNHSHIEIVGVFRGASGLPKPSADLDF